MLFDYTYRNDVKNDIRFVQLDNDMQIFIIPYILFKSNVRYMYFS